MADEYEKDERYLVFENTSCDRMTQAAILVHFEDLGKEAWIPISQVHEDSEVFEEGTKGDLIVKSWIAEDKGLV